jgi:hypothetical protein
MNRDPKEEIIQRVALAILCAILLFIPFFASPELREYIWYGPERTPIPPIAQKINETAKNTILLNQIEETTEKAIPLQSDHERPEMVQKLIKEMPDLEGKPYVETMDKMPKTKTYEDLEDLIKNLNDYEKLKDKTEWIDEVPEHEDIILYRGCTVGQFKQMVERKSAGGVEPDLKVSPPTEKMAVDQVGEIGRLPEFTSSISTADNFGTSSCVAAFRINTRFLTLGSTGEKGWVTNDAAPVELVAWYTGKKAK